MENNEGFHNIFGILMENPYLFQNFIFSDFRENEQSSRLCRKNDG